MAKILLLLFILFLSSCSPSSLSPNTKLIIKYQTLDEIRSPKHSKCSEKILPFRQIGRTDCSFTVDNLEFDIEKKYVLDSVGNTIEYWSYKAEGPVIATKNDLYQDTSILNYRPGTKRLVNVLDNGSQIVDKGDTLMIQRVFRAQQLILMKKKGYAKENGRRILYQYQ